EILRAPRRGSLGEQSRQLAAYVLVGRETRDTLAPGLQCALPDGRLAAMIEHEARIGTGLHELYHLGQLVVRGARVESESQAPHPTRLVRRTVGFDEHDALDRDLPRRRRIVRRKKRPVERSHPREPRIMKDPRVPEVNVGVDYAHSTTPDQLRIADFGLRIRRPPFHSAIRNPQSEIMLNPQSALMMWPTLRAPDPAPLPAR